MTAQAALGALHASLVSRSANTLFRISEERTPTNLRIETIYSNEPILIVLPEQPKEKKSPWGIILPEMEMPSWAIILPEPPKPDLIVVLPPPRAAIFGWEVWEEVTIPIDAIRGIRSNVPAEFYNEWLGEPYRPEDVHSPDNGSFPQLESTPREQPNPLGAVWGNREAILRAEF